MVELSFKGESYAEVISKVKTFVADECGTPVSRPGDAISVPASGTKAKTKEEEVKPKKKEKKEQVAAAVKKEIPKEVLVEKLRELQKKVEEKSKETMEEDEASAEGLNAVRDTLKTHGFSKLSLVPKEKYHDVYETACQRIQS